MKTSEILETLENAIGTLNMKDECMMSDDLCDIYETIEETGSCDIAAWIWRLDTIIEEVPETENDLRTVLKALS